MERIYKIEKGSKVNDIEIGGYISVKVMSRAERLKMRADAMTSEKKGEALEAEMMFLAQSELMKRIKKVDIKHGEDHYKTKECLEFFDEIAELFTTAIVEIATGPTLGKK